jgi:hypothetical protein
MIRRLRVQLTPANAMAAIAIFIALGGGIAWALASNTVKSRHIKDGQVKLQDLNRAAQAVGFTYIASTGDDVQEEILNVGGYRFTAACENVTGEPSVEFFMDFPQDGRLVGHGTTDPSDGPGTAASGNGVDVDGATPFDSGALTATLNESIALGATFTYVGQSKAATVNLHALANDDEDTCRVNGMLIPRTIPPA